MSFCFPGELDPVKDIVKYINYYYYYGIHELQNYTHKVERSPLARVNPFSLIPFLFCHEVLHKHKATVLQVEEYNLLTSSRYTYTHIITT